MIYGRVFFQILPWPPRVRDFTFYISAALFLIFGLKMLHEGYMMTPEEAAAEMEEVQQELGERRPAAAAAARERRDVERREELQLSLVVSEVKDLSRVRVWACQVGRERRRVSKRAESTAPTKATLHKRLFQAAGFRGGRPRLARSGKNGGATVNNNDHG